MLCTNYTEDEIKLLLEVGNMKKFTQYDDNQFVQLAKKIAIFKNLKESDIALIMLNPKFLRFANSQMILKDGIVNNEICYLVSGKIDIILNNNSVKSISNGSLFGLTSFVTKEPMPVSLISNGDSVVFSFNTNMQISTESKAYTYFLFYKNISKYLSSSLKELSKTMGYL